MYEEIKRTVKKLGVIGLSSLVLWVSGCGVSRTNIKIDNRPQDYNWSESIDSYPNKEHKAWMTRNGNAFAFDYLGDGVSIVPSKKALERKDDYGMVPLNSTEKTQARVNNYQDRNPMMSRDNVRAVTAITECKNDEGYSITTFGVVAGDPYTCFRVEPGKDPNVLEVEAYNCSPWSSIGKGAGPGGVGSPGEAGSQASQGGRGGGSEI
ncbi:MAG: hypothetical protein ABIB79_05625 [archaeon]